MGGASFWSVPELLWQNAQVSSVPSIAFYLRVLPPKSLGHPQAEIRPTYRASELVFPSSPESLETSGKIATAWNVEEQTVRVGNATFGRNEENCFMIDRQENGTPSISQISNLPEGLGIDAELLEHFRSQFPASHRLASLKPRYTTYQRTSPRIPSPAPSDRGIGAVSKLRVYPIGMASALSPKD